jgi:hypothetical protein
MRGRVIPRLRRDLLPERYAEDPQARSEKVCKALTEWPTEVLQEMGARRPNRPSTYPPYEPFALSLTPKALARLDQLGKISLSALVQEILSS